MPPPAADAQAARRPQSAIGSLDLRSGAHGTGVRDAAHGAAGRGEAAAKHAADSGAGAVKGAAGLAKGAARDAAGQVQLAATLSRDRFLVALS